MVPASDVSVADIAAAVRRRGGVLGIVCLLAAIFSTAYVVLTRPEYRASVVVIPTDEDGALSTLAAGFGPLASFAGVDLNLGSSSREANVAILRSRALAETFMAEQHVLPLLFPDLWDEQKNEWADREPWLLGRLIRAVARMLARISGDEGWSEPARGPTPGDAYEAFDKMRSVSQDARTGVITVSLTFHNPRLAAEWANAYIALANREIRERTVKESSQALQYLNQRLEQTSIVGLRETLFQLVQTHMERITLANVREQFAFRILDAAAVPERKAHPKRALIVFICVTAAAVLGAGAVVMWEGLGGRLVPEGRSEV